MLLYSLTKCLVKLEIFLLNFRALFSFCQCWEEKIYFYDHVHNNIAKSSSSNVKGNLYFFFLRFPTIIGDITMSTFSQLRGVQKRKLYSFCQEAWKNNGVYYSFSTTQILFSQCCTISENTSNCQLKRE